MKKTLSLLLAAMLILTFLGGCADNTEKPAETTAAEGESAPAEASETPQAPEAAASESPAEASQSIYPLTTEDITLTMYAASNVNVTNVIGELNNHQGYIKSEEITGIKLDIQTVMMEESATQMGLIMASQEYPDIFRGGNFPTGEQAALEDEVIIDLTDLMSQYAPNYLGIVSADDAIERSVTTDDGKKLCFYRIYQENGSYDISVTQGLIIRKDLLDELKMDVPTDLDGIGETLKAFKTQFNLSDALILQGSITTMGDNLISGYGIGSGFYQVDGTVYYGKLQKEFLDYIKLLKDWYDNGYLNKDFYSYSGNPNDSAQLGIKADHYGVGIYFDSSNNLDSHNAKTDEVSMMGMPNPAGPDGKNHFGLDANPVKGACYYISSQCKYPELAVQWCDFWYGDQGILLTNYGIEGVSFNYDENGEPRWTELMTNNPDGYAISICRQAYTLLTQHGIYINDIELSLLSDVAKEAVNTWTTSSDRAYLIPSLSYTTDESTQRAALMTDIQTLENETLLKMIVGEMSIDEFDSFIEQLKEFDIEQVIAIDQTALDRYNSR